MTDKNTLDLAREWAEWVKDNPAIYGGTSDRARAAADLIPSLPDEWVDAGKVRELLDKWATNPFPTSDEVAVLNDVEALLTAPPEPAGPRPENVPTGEAWFVEVGEREAVGYRNDPFDRFPWFAIYRSSVDFDYALDEEITLIARATTGTDSK